MLFMDNQIIAKKWGFASVEEMEGWGKLSHAEMMEGVGALGLSEKECQQIVDFWNSDDNYCR
jgi:hypothetical protein